MRDLLQWWPSRSDFGKPTQAMNHAPIDGHSRIRDLIPRVLGAGRVTRRTAFRDAPAHFGRLDGRRGARAWRIRKPKSLCMSIARIFTEEDRAKGLHVFELQVARTSVRSEDDRWHVRKDGSHIWVTGTVTAVRDEVGEVIGFVKIMRDRTDLRSQIETLENRLEAALQKHESIGLFLSTLGHEMRNPLSPLGTAGELIERQGPGAALARPLGIIRRQVAVLQRLANHLMDIAGGHEQARAPHEHDRSASLVERQRCRPAGEGAGQGRGLLRALLPEAPIRLLADGDRLQQVVLDLIDNALKYTCRRGARQRVTRPSRKGTRLLFVEDTGIGIPPELLPRVFELFTQGTLSAPGTDRGLGIGLALARDLARTARGGHRGAQCWRGQGLPLHGAIPSKPAARFELPLP